jgi:peroxiredoxin
VRHAAWEAAIVTAALVASTLTSVAGPAAERRPSPDTPPVIGPPNGSHIPEFTALDQDGKSQSFDTIRGPKGAVIYFHRSANWCIYCRMQLVQLEESRAALQRNGLGLCAVSFDDRESLRSFAAERHIAFPLLSDPGSEIIRRFGLLDPSVATGHPAFGVPIHGALLVDEHGIVRSRFFDGNVGHASGIVLTRLYTSPFNTHEKLVLHDQLRLKYYAAALAAAPGEALELVIEIALNEGILIPADHSPGKAAGVTWSMNESEAFTAGDIVLPPAVTRRAVPGRGLIAVYDGTVRLARRIVLTGDGERLAQARAPGSGLLLGGNLEFVTCNDSQCHSARKIPLRWSVELAATGPQPASAAARTNAQRSAASQLLEALAVQ